MKYQTNHIPHIKGVGLHNNFHNINEIGLQKAYHSEKNYMLMVTHFLLEGHQINKIGTITSLKSLFGVILEKANDIKTQMTY